MVAKAAPDGYTLGVGAEAYDLNVQQFCCAGLNFGYYYAGSRLILSDGEAPPPYTMGSFTPSTVPGCRAPHFCLADGRSLYDAFGPGYTLLRFDAHADVTALVRAAEACRVPLQVLDPLRVMLCRSNTTTTNWCCVAPISTWCGAAINCPHRLPAWWNACGAPAKHLRQTPPTVRTLAAVK